VSAGSAKVCFRIKVFFSFLNIKFLRNYLLGKLSLSCFFQVYWSKSAIITARCYAPAVLAMGLCPSVRLSVCLSVTSRSSTKTAKRRITQTPPHDSPWTLVF